MTTIGKQSSIIMSSEHEKSISLEYK